MKYTMVSRQLTRDYPFAVHKEGCADITRNERKKYASVVIDTVEADTIGKALEHFIDAEMKELGYGEESIRIYPCCDK